MMIDQDVAYVSPATVYNILKRAGLMGKRESLPSRKGKGFIQPTGPHRHWHVDISYINVCGTFYYLCSVLDGYSRYIVNWDIRESMKEADVELVIEGAKEAVRKGIKPRIISDNGPQFIAKDFKQYIRMSGMDHVRTSPYYPQSNGKIERWHKELKRDCIRARSLSDLAEARSAIEEFVLDYNTKRLHSAIGYVTPLCKLQGGEGEVFKNRDRKLEQARKHREVVRAMKKLVGSAKMPHSKVLHNQRDCYTKTDLRGVKPLLGGDLGAFRSQGRLLVTSG